MLAGHLALPCWRAPPDNQFAVLVRYGGIRWMGTNWNQASVAPVVDWWGGTPGPQAFIGRTILFTNQQQPFITAWSWRTLPLLFSLKTVSSVDRALSLNTEWACALHSIGWNGTVGIWHAGILQHRGEVTQHLGSEGVEISCHNVSSQWTLYILCIQWICKQGGMFWPVNSLSHTQVGVANISWAMSKWTQPICQATSQSGHDTHGNLVGPQSSELDPLPLNNNGASNLPPHHHQVGEGLAR